MTHSFLIPSILLILSLITAGIIYWFWYNCFRIESRRYLKALCCGNPAHFVEAPAVALTFDDGIHPEYTPKILEILEKHQIKATFFLIGEKAQAYPEWVRHIHANGHQIGIHSFYHRNSFPFQSAAAIRDELEQTRLILSRLVGTEILLFRPPFGVTNPMIAQATRQLNLTTIGWSIRSLDTRSSSIEQTLKRICKKLHPGGIILLHDTLPQAPELLEALLALLDKKKYQILSLEQILQIKFQSSLNLTK